MNQSNNRKKLAAIALATMIVTVIFVGVVNAPGVSAANEPSERFRGYNLATNSWDNSDLGKAYTEGDFVSYQLRIDSASKIWGAASFNIVFNFYQGSSDAVYVDGFDTSADTGFQYSYTSEFLPDGTNVPGTTWGGVPLAVKEAGDNPGINEPQITHYMDASPVGASDGTAGSSPSTYRYFTVANLPWETFSTGHVVIFFRAHLSLSIVWTHGIEKDMPSQLSGTEFTGWTAKHNGSSFATGSSRHFLLDYPGVGQKTIPIPIAKYPQLIIQGDKYLNNVLTNDWGFTLTGTLDLGDGLTMPFTHPEVFTGRSPDAGVTWATGHFSFDGMVAGTYTITEDFNGYQLSRVEVTATGMTGFTFDKDLIAGTVTFTVPHSGSPLVVTAKFFNEAMGTISGHKYEDKDGNLATTTDQVGVAGWQIRLLNAAGNVVGTFTTDYSGYYFFDKLLTGTYTVQELTADGWYNLNPTSQGVSISSGVSGTVDFVNARNGSLTVIKMSDTDGDGDGDVQIDWTFEVSGPNGYHMTDIHSGSTLTGLKQGVYTITESDNEEYYHQGETTQTVTLNNVGGASTLYQTVTFVNAKYGSLTVQKWEDVDGDGDGDKQVAWLFDITGPDGYVNNGVAAGTTVGNLELGSYTITERTVSGWYSVSSTSQTVTLSAGSVAALHQTVAFVNAQYGSLTLIKLEDTDGDGDGDVRIDWTFNVTGPNGYSAINVVSGSTLNNLKLGTYEITEASHSGWYRQGEESQTLVLTAESSETLYQTATFINSKLGGLTILKYEDLDGSMATYDDQNLIDWSFHVTGPGFDQTVAAGEVLTGLKLGTYTITEESVSGWYALDDTTKSVTLSDTDPDYLDQVVTFVNSQKGSLAIYKYLDENGDGTGDSRIEWTFTVTGPNDYVMYDVAAGTVLTDLELGTYEVTEDYVSGWYAVTQTTQTITLSADSAEALYCSVTFVNSPFASLTIYKYEDQDGVLGTDDDRVLVDWTFNVTGPDGFRATNVLAGVPLTGLKLGTYTITEAEHSGWYSLTPVTQTVVLSAGEEGNLAGVASFVNSKLGSLVIYKYSDADGSLSTANDRTSIDWTFHVVGPEVDQMVSAGQTLTGLKLGTYIITEVTEPGWYPLSNPSVTITLDDEAAANLDQTVEFVNAQYGSLTLQKLEDLNGDNIGDQEIEWLFDVTGPNDYYNPGVASGTTLDDLELGEYTITERAVGGWYSITDETQSVTLSSTTTENLKQTVTFINARYASLVINKYEDRDGDLETDDDQVPVGWTFNVTGPNNFVALNVPAGFKLENLKLGTYTVTEAEHSGWYALSEETQEIALSAEEDGVLNGGMSFFNAKFGSLMIQKYEDLDGNLATSEDQSLIAWTFHVVGPEVDQMVSAGQTLTGLKLGTYTITEDMPTGWYSLTSETIYVTLSDDSPSQLNQIGSFVNSKLGALTLEKWEDVDGDGVGDREIDWFFNVTGPNGYNQINVPAGTTLRDLELGSYTVTEWTSSAWYSITNDVQTVVLSGTSDTTLHQTVQFVNSQYGSLTLQKWEDVNGDGAGDRQVAWSFDVFGPNDYAMYDVQAGTILEGLKLGTYTVVEATDPAWYAWTSLSQEVVISADTVAQLDQTATFVNSQYGSLIIYKYDDADGSLGTDDDRTSIAWSFHVTGPGGYDDIVNAGELVTGLWLGVYTITEAGDPDYYALTSTSATVTLSGETTATLNQEASFVNAQFGSLTILKYEDLDGDLSTTDDLVARNDWTFDITGPGEYVNNGVLAGTVLRGLKLGTYTITESERSGWYNLGLVVQTVTLTANEGELDQTVTFVNSEYGSLTLEKLEDVDGDGTGDREIAWTFDVSGPNGYFMDDVAAGTTLSNLKLGIYTVSENTDSEWYALGDTSKDVTLSAYSNAALYQTASFVNSPYGSLVIYKWDDRDGDITTTGDRVSIDWTFHVTGPNFDQVVSAGIPITGLKLGVYTITETDDDGWYALSDVTQTVTISDDENGELNAMASFVNARYGSLTIYKYEDVNGDGDGESLIDWTFNVTGPNGFVALNVPAGFKLENLKLGTYTIVEADHTGWYSVSEPEQTVVISSTDTATLTSTVSFVNAMYGSLTIYKYQDLDYDGLGEVAIDWTFNVTGPNGFVALNVPAGTTLEDLELGTYTIVEADRTYWYAVDGRNAQTCALSAENLDATVVFVNFMSAYPGGHTIGFWKNNIAKNLGYLNGRYQVTGLTIQTYLDDISSKYGSDYSFLNGLSLEEAYVILNIPTSSNMVDKAGAQILSLLLTAEFRAPQFGGSWVYLPDVGQGSTYSGTGIGAIGYILDLYGDGDYAAAQRLADGMNNAPAYVDWYAYW